MKKLLTLTALVAGVALFAGCMNQPTEVEEEVTTPVVEEVVAPVVEEVVTEEVATDETVTPEEVVEPTAE
jgi:uncharacterized lipoprotein YajG